MNRLISLLLIPLFMLGQPLPHSHAGTGIIEPDGHSIRPHIHVAGGHSHDTSDHHHVHAGQSAADGVVVAVAETAPTDHNSDAIYLVDGKWTASRTVVVSKIVFAELAWTSLAPVNREVDHACRFSDPPDRYAGLPIYLLTASLRL
jgi:hypothetical protein